MRSCRVELQCTWIATGKSRYKQFMSYRSILCTVIVSPISTHQVFSDHQRASSRFRNEVFDRCGWYLLGDLDDPRMKKQAAV